MLIRRHNGKPRDLRLGLQQSVHVSLNLGQPVCGKTLELHTSHYRLADSRQRSLSATWPLQDIDEVLAALRKLDSPLLVVNQLSHAPGRFRLSKLNARRWRPIAVGRGLTAAFIFQMAVPVVLISSLIATVIGPRSSQDATYPKQPPPQHHQTKNH